ncbi:MAG: tetratricopeptide repeat protein [Methanoregula sp.]|jgi:tetratricopeptide (TPR) repeat protein|nr:tetratricopeptide repeat protein [Methanoregula sp.]
MRLNGIHGTFSEAEYLVRQAREMAMSGDHDAAINYLKQAIIANPRYSEAYTLLGNCQDCLGHDEDAVVSYNQALAIDPCHADAWFNKGMSLKKMGQTKEASQCIEKSIDLYCR